MVHYLIHGIRLLKRMHITKACVYSDSVNSINMIKGDTSITSNVHHWILQIRKMAEFFEALSFLHVSRHWNRKSDYLAKHALSQQNSMLSLENLPQ